MNTQYKCHDCGRVTNEYRRFSFRNSEEKVIYKCPYCRGRFSEVIEWGRKRKKVKRLVWPKEIPVMV